MCRSFKIYDATTRTQIQKFASFYIMLSNKTKVEKRFVFLFWRYINIPVILLARQEPQFQIFIDSEPGKNRKILDLAACELSAFQRKALLGLHAFSGNDYISLFSCTKSLIDTTVQYNMFHILHSTAFLRHFYGISTAFLRLLFFLIFNIRLTPFSKQVQYEASP